MSILDYLLNYKQNSILIKNALTYKDMWESGDIPTKNGYSGGVTQAMRVSAVMACVRILSESIASLPLILYRRTDQGKERATDMPLYYLLHDKPNNIQTSFTWREMSEGHLTLNGNALSKVIRAGDQIREIIPLKPEFTVRMVNDILLYDVSHQDGTTETLTQREVLHIAGLTLDGVLGISPIEYARKTIGLSENAENYGADQFKSGGTQRIALELPPNERPDQAGRDLLRKSWEDKYAGNAKVAILTGGMQAKVIGMNAKDAQYLETRKFQIEEIARIYRVPPHMIGELSRSTNNNIEQQTRSFVDYTLRPWLTRWEQAMNRDLLRNSRKYFIEFNVEGMLRGDTQARTDHYRKALGNTNNGEPGWMSVEEVRIKENMNPTPEIGTLVSGTENNDANTDEQQEA